jgi:hypothetical protein
VTLNTDRKKRQWIRVEGKIAIETANKAATEI